jgi:mannosylglycerate hydrolase
MLVSFMDELVELLEEGRYAGFVMDGQIIPVLDYLEMRPEMEDRIRSLVTEGKLQIGPWFTLPDEYPVDGEALVRNLLWGIRKSENLGGAFRVGYTSFGWGQTAQLPQIYAGFGIDTVMVGKGVSSQRAPNSEFLWKAPDGSELLATRFGDDGRSNFYFSAHLSILFGIDYKGPQWKYDWSAKGGGIAYHEAHRERMEQDHFRLDAPSGWYPDSVSPELIEAVWSTTNDSVLDHSRLMMNGSDYGAAQQSLPEMIKKINEIDPDPQRQWVQATLPAFAKLMQEEIDFSKLRVVEGELRDGPVGPLTGNALATRLYIKQLNHRAQTMLIRVAEPLAAMASIATGAEYPNKFLEKAWQFLLESHPHDSINGATQDKSSQDVTDRLNQVLEISQTVSSCAMQELVRYINTSSFAGEDVLLVVFNPFPYPRNEVLEAWINMPDRRPCNETWRAYRSPEGLQLFDAGGNPVSTQNQGYTSETYSVSELHTRAFPFNCLRHKIFFDAGEIPGGGYKVFRVSEMDEKETGNTMWSDSFACTRTLLTAPDTLENEYLLVRMNSNGTFSLTDKKSGVIYPGLNYYEDRGELGDYWLNEHPLFDQVHTSLGAAARIWALERGPLQATLVSEITLQLPDRGDHKRKSRGDALAPLVIQTSVTIRAGERLARVKVEFENHHQDHYLRVMFPTGLKQVTHVSSGGHFGVDQRPVRIPGPTENSIWPDMATQPMDRFLDISDGTTGLAFLSDDFTEYEVSDNSERTVALSILRSVRNWICTETRVGSGFPSQSGGQSLGRHVFLYGIHPHEGNWQKANILLAAELFRIPIFPVQTNAHEGSLQGDQDSFLAMDNPAIQVAAQKSAVERASLIVRLYNPTPLPQEGKLNIKNSIRGAWVTDLNEQRKGELRVEQERYCLIQLNPHQILTVEIDIFR